MSLVAALVLLVQCAALSPEPPQEVRDLGDGLVLCDGKVEEVLAASTVCV